MPRHASFLALPLTVLACWLTASCTVPPPTVQQRLAYGFHTPEQLFESFRTAVQGNLLADEYRCFSHGWRDATGLTSFNYYDLLRDEVIAEVPHLRWALHHAKAPVVIQEGRTARLISRVPGPMWAKDRWLVFEMEREGYWDIWTSDVPSKPTEGNVVRDPVSSGLLEYDELKDRYRVNVDQFSVETDDLDPADVIAVKAGWQWKILEFRVVDNPPAIRQ